MITFRTGCPICGRINETGLVCPECTERLHRADELAQRPRGVGCVLGVLIGTLFWCLVYLIIKIVRWL
jgi:hypothetical protein